MSDGTRIEWTDAVWNPVTGCTKISQGRAHCYAERQARRFSGMNGYPADEPFKVTLHPDTLDLPLRWRKPRRIFVSSMSDLFHPDVPDEFIDQVFTTMALCSQHTFQILTKRPERMAAYINGMRRETIESYGETFIDIPRLQSTPDAWPLPNVWLGVSVEDQQAADERIPLLLQTPASVRFVSAEPLLGSVDVRPYLPQRLYVCQKCGEEVDDTALDHNDRHAYCGGTLDDNGTTDDGLDWVIASGESGLGARPMEVDWARSLRDQCQAAGVAFLFKQWGEFCCPSQLPDDTWERLDAVNANANLDLEAPNEPIRVGKKAAGRLLDGVLHDEYPEVRA